MCVRVCVSPKVGPGAKGWSYLEGWSSGKMRLVLGVKRLVLGVPRLVLEVPRLVLGVQRLKVAEVGLWNRPLCLGKSKGRS